MIESKDHTYGSAGSGALPANVIKEPADPGVAPQPKPTLTRIRQDGTWPFRAWLWLRACANPEPNPSASIPSWPQQDMFGLSPTLYHLPTFALIRTLPPEQVS